MRESRLIRKFNFGIEFYRLYTFSDPTKIGMTRDGHAVSLKLDSAGAYSLDDDIYVATPLWNPDALLAWLKFQLERLDSWFSEDALPDPTSIGFRLSDGTNTYWWDGAAWDSAPVSGEWNTENQVDANIATFPVTDKKLQVLINLKTTNAAVTPIVNSVRVLWNARLDEEDDIIYRSLLPLLKTARPYAEWLPSSGLSASTDTFVLSEGGNLYVRNYDVKEVFVVYDETNDPSHTTNLFSSFTEATKTLVTTAPIAVGAKLFLGFDYQPIVMVTKNQDFVELEILPVLQVEEVDESRHRRSGGYDWIVDKDSPTFEAVKLPDPLQVDLTVTLRLATTRGVDLRKLDRAVKQVLEQPPQKIRSTALDEEYDLEYQPSTLALSKPNLQNVHETTLQFVIYGVRFWLRPAEDSHFIQSVQTTVDKTVTAGSGS